jgi:hypothetical protein
LAIWSISFPHHRLPHPPLVGSHLSCPRLGNYDPNCFALSLGKCVNWIVRGDRQPCGFDRHPSGTSIKDSGESPSSDNRCCSQTRPALESNFERSSDLRVEHDFFKGSMVSESASLQVLRPADRWLFPGSQCQQDRTFSPCFHELGDVQCVSSSDAP